MYLSHISHIAALEPRDIFDCKMAPVPFYNLFVRRNRRYATYERGSARGDGMKFRDEKTHQTDNSNT